MCIECLCRTLRTHKQHYAGALDAQFLLWSKIKASLRSEFVSSAIDDNSATPLQQVQHFIAFIIAQNGRRPWTKLEYAQRDRIRAACLADVIPDR
jgi:hypothetical protein